MGDQNKNQGQGDWKKDQGDWTEDKGQGQHDYDCAEGGSDEARCHGFLSRGTEGTARCIGFGGRVR